MPVSFSQLGDNYDIVVVGSGLGGLTCANRLARCGHRILLLEHHHRLGGLATWFKRKGHIFDVSLHGFPFGMVKTCKKYWNKTITASIVQLKNIVFDNPQFSLHTTFDREDFTRLLNTRFKVPLATIERFFATVAAMNFYDDQAITTRELFEQFRSPFGGQQLGRPPAKYPNRQERIDRRIGKLPDTLTAEAADPDLRLHRTPQGRYCSPMTFA